jgi:predicted phosphodiesterase
VTPPRVQILPERGRLLVSADLHGNLEDFERLRALFLESMQRRAATHWVLLGDAVHGPSERAAAEDPELHGFVDRSWEIVAELIQLTKRYPDRIHYLLGNHDHGHLSGRRTAKFHPDEVAALESRLSGFQIAQLRAFLERALLAAVAPCGLLMSHACPDGRLERLEDLDAVRYDPAANDPYHQHLLRTFLWPYGQPESAIDQLLETASRIGARIGVVVHGHDRDEEGWFIDGDHCLCPVIFGAPRHAKRYLSLDLAGRYRDVFDLRENREILRLYDPCG